MNDKASSASVDREVGKALSGMKLLAKGESASPGLASGIVRQILSPKEINKLRAGEVMVTSMTTPDFVPAMKRAAALVTDRGGQTSHAAIVSRELGLPCVVGTGDATKKLKDGQVVTVNGKTGEIFAGGLQASVFRWLKKKKMSMFFLILL